MPDERSRDRKGKRIAAVILATSATLVAGWFVLCEIHNAKARALAGRASDIEVSLKTVLADLDNSVPKNAGRAYDWARNRPGVLVRAAAKLSEMQTVIAGLPALREELLEERTQLKPIRTDRIVQDAEIRNLSDVAISLKFAVGHLAGQLSTEAAAAAAARELEIPTAIGNTGNNARNVSLQAVADKAREEAAFSRETMSLSDDVRACAWKCGQDRESMHEQGMDALAAVGKSAAKKADNLAKVYEDGIRAYADAKKQIQFALSTVQGSDAIPETDASVQQMRPCLDRWSAAGRRIGEAEASLKRPNLRHYGELYQSTLYVAALQTEATKLEKPITQFREAAGEILRLFDQAVQEESTLGGKLARSIRRGTRTFAESRIGQELKVAFNSLVLGSKMFYEVMDMKPGSDIQRWAESHVQDMDRLSQDMQNIQNMDGWSLTGKNTPVEDLVNKMYDDRFRK